MINRRLRVWAGVVLAVNLGNTQCANDSSNRDRGANDACAAALYERGREYAQDDNYTEAFADYSSAAELGYTKAQFDLGSLFEDGKGVPQHYSKAAHWYQCAAAQGHGSAQFRLGVMYAEGKGVCASDVMAHAWFNLAAAQNHHVAAYERDRVEERMTPDAVADAHQLASGDLLFGFLCGGVVDDRACPPD